MNWYKKASFYRRASIDFFPDGVEKISEPMNVLDITHDMRDYAWYKGKQFSEGQGIHMETIAPDGDSAFQSNGTINIYVPDSKWNEDRQYTEIPEHERLSQEQVKSLVKGYNSYKDGMVVLGYPELQTSNMTGGPVYRVPVLKNQTSTLDRIPRLNVANANARVILEILQFHGLPVNPDDYSGEFDALDYIGARQLMSNETLERFQRERTQDGNMWDAGLDVGRINAYMDGLDQIATWMQKNQLPNQTIVFG